MRWANFLHIYQPPHWPETVIAKVTRESYRPLVRFLLAHPHIRLTLNISGSLTDQLRSNGFRDILVGIRRLLRRNQLELTGSAMYHPILPLLPDHEVVRQINLNHRANRRAFGAAYAPRGFFPPEMAYSPSLAATVSRLGYRWILLDGISHPALVDYRLRSHIRGTELVPVFRNRYISDYLAFAAELRDVPQFMKTVRAWNGASDVLITAMDGENLGHHRRAARRLWQTLVRQPSISTVTISDLIETLVPSPAITPRAASWSTRAQDLRRGVPFPLWRNPSNPLHRLQWRLLKSVLAIVEESGRRKRLPATVRHAFDEALSSDGYWWASREPWWSVDIITTAAHRLETIAHELGPNRACREVEALVRQIIACAQAWHASGAAQRHAARFLSRDAAPRYLGGERVVYTKNH